MLSVLMMAPVFLFRFDVAGSDDSMIHVPLTRLPVTTRRLLLPFELRFFFENRDIIPNLTSGELSRLV